MLKNLKKLVAGVLVTSMLLPNVMVSASRAPSEELIRDHIEYVRKKNLRYEDIKANLKQNGFPGVTTEQIDEVLTEMIEEDGAGRKQVGKGTSPFVMTMSMLGKRFNEIVWPGTHNSFSNDDDATNQYGYLSVGEANTLSQSAIDFGELGKKISTENNNISMKEQLNRGIRALDIDLGPRQNFGTIVESAVDSTLGQVGEAIVDGIKFIFTGGKSKPPTMTADTFVRTLIDNIEVDWNNVDMYHRIAAIGVTPVSKLTTALTEFLEENPNEIVSIKISDLYTGPVETTDLKGNDDRGYKLLNMFLKKMDQAGLLEQTANYFGSGVATENNYHEYLLMAAESSHGHSMEKWPMLKDMILNNKRIIIITPEMNRIKGNDNTRNNNTEIAKISRPNGAPEENAPERISDDQDRWDRLNENPEKLVLLWATDDNNLPAGEFASSNINNDGRRAYDLMKAYNKKLADNNATQIVNFFMTDYFVGLFHRGGNQEVDIVDAANRINLENQGYAWEYTDLSQYSTRPYWNYISRAEDTDKDINKYVKNITTTIPNIDPQVFLDGNVWSGTIKQNLKGKKITVHYTRNMNFYFTSFNFIPVSGDIPVKMYVVNGPVRYQITGTVEERKNVSWTNVGMSNFRGNPYMGQSLEIVFEGNQELYLKELAIFALPHIPKPIPTSYTTETIEPEDDTYVKLGDFRKYTYGPTGNLLVHKSSGLYRHAKESYMEFNLDFAKDKTIKSAFLEYSVHVEEAGNKLIINEKPEFNDWSEETLNGNATNHLDRIGSSNIIIHDTSGRNRVNITDLIREFTTRGNDYDNKMTLKFWTDKVTKDFYIYSKEAESHLRPKLIIEYGVN